MFDASSQLKLNLRRERGNKIVNTVTIIIFWFELNELLMSLRSIFHQCISKSSMVLISVLSMILYDSSIEQFWYIKNQPETRGLSKRFWGINPINSVVIPQSLVVRFGLNFNISKLVYFFYVFSTGILRIIVIVNCCIDWARLLAKQKFTLTPRFGVKWLREIPKLLQDIGKRWELK